MRDMERGDGGGGEGRLEETFALSPLQKISSDSGRYTSQSHPGSSLAVPSLLSVL